MPIRSLLAAAPIPEMTAVACSGSPEPTTAADPSPSTLVQPTAPAETPAPAPRTARAPTAPPATPVSTPEATATPDPTAEAGTAGPQLNPTPTPGDGTSPPPMPTTEISTEEERCLGPETLELMAQGETVDIPMLKFVISCLSDVSINRMFLVEPVIEDSPLSETTVDCMENSGAAPALREAIASIGESQEEAMDAFWAMLTLTLGALFASLDCMTPDERAIFGSELDLDNAGIDCVIDALEESGGLIAAVLVQDATALAELEQSMTGCRTDHAPTTPVPPEPTGAAPIGCADFLTRQAVQKFFLAEGGPAQDPHHLDTNGDGQACNSRTDQDHGIFPPVLTPGEEQHAARAQPPGRIAARDPPRGRGHAGPDHLGTGHLEQRGPGMPPAGLELHPGHRERRAGGLRHPGGRGRAPARLPGLQHHPRLQLSTADNSMDECPHPATK